MTKYLSLANIRKNWQSGLTVSLVSIPLSVSLAIASGATPIMGIVTAIWAGLIASIFAGSNFNIVGPTGALSGILATYAIGHGLSTLPSIAIITGIIIFIAYLLRLERYMKFIPANTVQGFTLGVAFIIAFNQFNFAFGIKGLPAHERFIDNVIESITHISQGSLETGIVFVLFLATMFALIRFAPKLPTLFRLPPAVLLSPVGILLGYLSLNKLIPLHLQTLGEKYADLSGTIFLPNHLDLLSRPVLITSLTVAIIAILETMISAKIADALTKTKHQQSREILALSLANIGSGLMGGIPATAALARTALNIKSGADNKISATISSISVAVISIFLLTFFKFIPMAVIAAILVNVAIRMVEREHLERMFRIDRKNFVIAIIVAVITIYEDPIIGIIVGTAISLFLFMDKLSRGQFEMIINDKHRKIVDIFAGEKVFDLKDESHTLFYSIKGHLTYVDGQAHVARFEKEIQNYEIVVLRLKELFFIDIDGVDALDEMIEIIKGRGKEVFICGTNNLIMHMLTASKQYQKLTTEGKVFENTQAVLTFLNAKHPKKNS